MEVDGYPKIYFACDEESVPVVVLVIIFVFIILTDWAAPTISTNKKLHAVANPVRGLLDSTAQMHVGREANTQLTRWRHKKLYRIDRHTDPGKDHIITSQ